MFTNNASRCSVYQEESQNVKSRFACVLPSGSLSILDVRRNRAVIPSTQEGCEVSSVEDWFWLEMKDHSKSTNSQCITCAKMMQQGTGIVAAKCCANDCSCTCMCIMPIPIVLFFCTHSNTKSLKCITNIIL